MYELEEALHGFPQDPDFIIIEDGLKEAKKYGMEMEFVYSLVYELRNNPKVPVNEAVYNALLEWDLI